MIPHHRFPQIRSGYLHLCAGSSWLYCCQHYFCRFESLQKSLTLLGCLKYFPSRARYDTGGNLAVKAAVKWSCVGCLLCAKEKSRIAASLRPWPLDIGNCGLWIMSWISTGLRDVLPVSSGENHAFVLQLFRSLHGCGHI